MDDSMLYYVVACFPIFSMWSKVVFQGELFHGVLELFGVLLGLLCKDDVEGSSR